MFNGKYILPIYTVALQVHCADTVALHEYYAHWLGVVKQRSIFKRQNFYLRGPTGNNRIRWKHEVHWDLKYIYIHRYIYIYIYIYINSIYIWKRPEKRGQHKLVRACAIPDRLTSEQSRWCWPWRACLLLLYRPNERSIAGESGRERVSR